MQRQLLETRPLPLFRLLQLPDLIIELSGSRGFATWHEQRRNVGNAQKKRKRRIENARLRDWMANEDRISWVADREDITPRSATDARSPDQKSWSAWRHMQSVYGSRKNNNNNNNSKGWAKSRRRPSTTEDFNGGANGTFEDDWIEGDWFETEQFRNQRLNARKHTDVEAEAHRAFERMTSGFKFGTGSFSRGWHTIWQGDPQPHPSSAARKPPLHSAPVVAHLRVLNMPPDNRFDAAGLKAAFHARCKSCHPDLIPGPGKQAAESQFKSVKAAYDALLMFLQEVPI